MANSLKIVQALLLGVFFALTANCDSDNGGLILKRIKLSSEQPNCACGDRVFIQDCPIKLEAIYKVYGSPKPDPTEQSVNVSMIYEDYGSPIPPTINGITLLAENAKLSKSYKATFEFTPDLDPEDYGNPADHRAIVNVTVELKPEGLIDYAQFQQIKPISKSRLFCAYWADANGNRLIYDEEFDVRPGDRVTMVGAMLGAPSEMMSMNFHPYESDITNSQREHLGENTAGVYDDQTNRYIGDWVIPFLQDDNANVITGDLDPEFVFQARLKDGDTVFDDMFTEDELKSD